MIRWILLSAGVLVPAVLLISYICFRMAFYVPRKPGEVTTAAIPDTEIYGPFHKILSDWTRETQAMPREEVSITSFDGLTLYGNFYEYAPGAPIELMFHGYRGSAQRDLAGGVQRCFGVGRSALIVDQRSHGRSEGKVITMGIREHRDCLSWIDFMLRHFGPDVKIILTGISMGAATVLMCADKPLPENVIGILADCGYSSPKDIIREVIRGMGIPPALGYPFVKLGARLYGGFDLEEGSPAEALRRSTRPVIFYHGESDDFVPCHMSRSNFEACSSRKALVTIPGAGHGLSFPMDQETYLRTLKDFFGPEASFKE